MYTKRHSSCFSWIYGTDSAGKKHNSGLLNCGLDPEIISEPVTYLDKIPDNVREQFYEDGWRVIFTMEDFGSKYGSGPLTALAVDGEPGAIYISDKLEDPSSIIHEFGHYVDYTSGYTSECNEFVAVYDAGLDSFLSFCDPLPYYYSNSSEYFAEAYRQCILFPDEMSKYCPLTYLYIILCSDSL